jgi:outer membrane receptor protein involved in Fe transport
MKPILISIVIYLLILPFTGISSPENGNFEVPKGSIQGKIVSQKGNNSIEYVSISIYSFPDSTLITGSVTKVDGSFRIGKLPNGTYYLVANYMGFNKKVISPIEITEKKQFIDCGTIILEEASFSLAGVEIAQEKPAIEYKMDKKVIHADAKLDSKGGSVVNLLENTPSIQVDIEGNVSLRGSTNFIVLINGKPTALSGNDALKQIPANSVQDIEIITNPSAKYDPDGTTGIINIIMKKNSLKSFSALMNGSVGTYHNYAGDFNLNYKNEKINVYLSGNGSYNGSYPYNTMESELNYGDSSRFTSQTEQRTQRVTPYSIQGGLDWNISNFHTLSAEYSWGYWGMNMNIPTYTKETFSSNPIQNYSLTKSLLDIGGFYQNFSLVDFIQLDTLGQSLKTSLVFALWDGHNITDVNDLMTESDFISITDGIHHISERDDNTKAIQLKIDYNLPINKIYGLEFGYLGNLKGANSGYSLVFQDFDTQEWDWNHANNHDMKFSQNIQAIYGTFGAQWKKIQVLAGLRGEYYGRDLKIVNQNESFSVNKLYLFPTLHITLPLKNNYQMQFSYSRRIDRPREWNLFPYPLYSDKYISQVGNPYLMPQLTDSYEINLMKPLAKGYFAIESFYRQTNNAFSQEMTIDTSGIILIRVENLNKQYAYGIEMSGNYRLAKWVSVSASGSLYSYNVTQTYGNVIQTNRSINSDWVLNTTFRFWKSFRVQLVGFYNSPKVTSQGSEKQMYGVNLSLAKDFFNQKLTISLTGRDLFHTANYTIITDTPQLKSTFTMKNEYPVIVLNIGYKFNNYKRRAPIETEKEPVFEGGSRN